MVGRRKGTVDAGEGRWVDEGRDRGSGGRRLVNSKKRQGMWGRGGGWWEEGRNRGCWGGGRGGGLAPASGLLTQLSRLLAISLLGKQSYILSLQYTAS